MLGVACKHSRHFADHASTFIPHVCTGFVSKADVPRLNIFWSSTSNITQSNGLTPYIILQSRLANGTRIIHAGNRVGENAKVAMFEIVCYEYNEKEKKGKPKKEEPAEAAS